MLSPGDRAPEFTLSDHEGRDTSLTSLLRSGALILYFYPADFTPGCTREACAIRDLHAEILKVGLNVAGVSPQGADSHRRFREQHHLPFTLLSDPDKSVIRMYDVDGPLGFGAPCHLPDRSSALHPRCGAGRLPHQRPRCLHQPRFGARRHLTGQ